MSVDFPAVPLWRYAYRVGYRETAFFGVMHPDNHLWACRQVWSKSQREAVAWALLEAQEEIEVEVGYPLVPKWFTDERLVYRRNLRTRQAEVIAGGVISDTMLAAGEAVDYSADPATVTVTVGTCVEDDLHLFLPGTDIEVTPSEVAVVAGAATFSIPWARLVAEDYLDNPTDGWDYNDVATWGTGTLDVRCITNDPSTQATLIARHVCTLPCSRTGCSDYRETACIYVENGRLGVVSVERADYASGVWTRKCVTRAPQWALLNYQAGLTAVTRQAEDMVIRLAHAKMAEEPCGCEVTQRLWRRDRNVPEILTRERANCPFGMSDGAWIAWRFAQTMKRVRGSVL